MKGNLKDFSTTQLLNLVSLAKRSGTLLVDRHDSAAQLSFKDGKLVFAALGDSDGSLTSVLLRSGKLKISADQAKALTERAKKVGDKQLGLLLINAGYVTQADIIQSIKTHALTTVNEFAHWTEGAFQFDRERLPGDDRITVPLDLENIIIRIARERKLDEQLLDEIPSMDVGLRFTEEPKSKLKDLELSAEEWKVIRYINEENTLRMIATALRMSDNHLRRVVYNLREAGLVEIVPRRRKREQLTEQQKVEKRDLVGRLIGHFKSMGAEQAG
jgi:DNA-binding MarR family transcriptional regulator